MLSSNWNLLFRCPSKKTPLETFQSTFMADIVIWSFFSWNCLDHTVSICFTRVRIFRACSNKMIVLLASNVSNSTFVATRCTRDSDWGTSTTTYLGNENWAYTCAVKKKYSLNGRLKVETRTKHWPGRAWKGQEVKDLSFLSNPISPCISWIFALVLLLNCQAE